VIDCGTAFGGNQIHHDGQGFMSDSSAQDVTQLLLAWGQGDQAAFEQLLPLVYEELRRQAKRYMRQQRPGHTLQTTALVNEAYLQLVRSDQVRWQNRAHFFAVSAQLMRRILVDFARARQNLKRGGAVQHITLDDTLQISAKRGAELVALDDALSALAKFNERQSKVVELRYFGGLSEEEVAEVLDLSPRTVRRDWRVARAWLYSELSKETDDA
jgi:RNA polymerase sigma factor (TIGR02999 family)